MAMLARGKSSSPLMQLECRDRSDGRHGHADVLCVGQTMREKQAKTDLERFIVGRCSTPVEVTVLLPNRNVAC
jgi:hypothetical protein